MKRLAASIPFAVLALLIGQAGRVRADPDADPELTLRSGRQERTFTRSELLKRSDIETIVVAKDPAYAGRPMSYRAVRATALFDGLTIAGDAVIQFRCLDGFSAPISKERLLNRRPAGSLAYVAIEDAAAPWPPLRPGGPSAGPYYLIWVRPEASFIGPEEWPFQLAAFDVEGTLESLYPQIVPDRSLGPASPVRRGFDVFTKNCFACHTLNEAGSSTIGPDLNVPMNPTEYLQGAALRRLIRDPQSLRRFPGSRMSAFPKDILSEKDLDHLIAYLKHMARRKIAPRGSTQSQSR